MATYTLNKENHSRDAAIAKELHGKDATEKVGFRAIIGKNKKAQQEACDEYFAFWDKKKPGQETEQDRKEREENYAALTRRYYDLATDFYQYGWGDSFHFCRYAKGEGFKQAIARHEHYLAARMGMSKDMRVLDVGCGIGGPAREIATFSGAYVTGLNNNDYQIARAKQYTLKRGLQERVDFVKGDFMQIAFPNGVFDQVYAIEATVHAPSLERVYGEIFRVLKSGGTFGVYEWLMSDDYDETNPHHREIAYGIEVGDGIPKMVKKQDAVAALKKVGFEIIEADDLALKDDELPWYYPLAGDITKAQSIFDYAMAFKMTKYGRFCTQTAVGLLERFGLAAKGAQKVGATLETAADALVAGGQEKLFTPMMLYVCRKP